MPLIRPIRGGNISIHTHVPVIHGGFSKPNEPSPDDQKNALKRKGAYILAPKALIRVKGPDDWEPMLTKKHYKQYKKRARQALKYSKKGKKRKKSPWQTGTVIDELDAERGSPLSGW